MAQNAKCVCFFLGLKVTLQRNFLLLGGLLQATPSPLEIKFTLFYPHGYLR